MLDHCSLMVSRRKRTRRLIFDEKRKWLTFNTRESNDESGRRSRRKKKCAKGFHFSNFFCVNKPNVATVVTHIHTIDRTYDPFERSLFLPSSPCVNELYIVVVVFVFTFFFFRSVRFNFAFPSYRTQLFH